MGEIANIPSPCRNNVEGVLNRNSLSYFNALLLATGVQRPVFASGENHCDCSNSIQGLLLTAGAC
jgi:hypothetical protein